MLCCRCCCLLVKQHMSTSIQQCTVLWSLVGGKLTGSSRIMGKWGSSSYNISWIYCVAVLMPSWIYSAIALMTYPASTLHCHVTGIVIGESWLGGQGMQKGTECLPVTPFPLLSSGSVQGASIDDKQETKMTMTPLMWRPSANQRNIKFLPDRLRSLKMRCPASVIVHLSAALLLVCDICRKSWMTLVSSSHASVLERKGCQWIKWFKIIFLHRTAAVF